MSSTSNFTNHCTFWSHYLCWVANVGRMLVPIGSFLPCPYMAVSLSCSCPCQLVLTSSPELALNSLLVTDKAVALQSRQTRMLLLTCYSKHVLAENMHEELANLGWLCPVRVGSVFVQGCCSSCKTAAPAPTISQAHVGAAFAVRF